MSILDMWMKMDIAFAHWPARFGGTPAEGPSNLITLIIALGLDLRGWDSNY